MIRLVGNGSMLCDRITRREFMRVGSVGALSLPALLSSQAVAGPGAAGFGRAKRCLLLFLTGGPPQHDTWDPKPDAPAEVRGEFKPIDTTVPGIRVTELFPKLARQAHRFCVIRSVTHSDTVHTSAGYTMLTGVNHPLANAKSARDIRPRSDDRPHVGAVLARARPAGSGMPEAVSLPEVIADDVVNVFPGQTAGCLGRQFDPFLVGADIQSARFLRPEIDLPTGVDSLRLANRRELLSTVDRRMQHLERHAEFQDLNAIHQRAFSIVASNRARQAFDLDREPRALREAYGSHLFGQGCLLGRRLLEAGVSLVTVYWHYEGPQDSPVWDTHANNFRHLRERLVPPTDLALSALFEDLHQRGMLADTLVICMGEFGRTPKVNGAAGRDHWPHVQSILMAGAGTPSGAVYGSSDAQGAYPDESPVSPADLTATVLHRLGVPPDLEMRDRTGQPFRACDGTAIQGLVS